MNYQTNTFPDIVIAILGGATAAAKFFDVTVGAVPQWRHKGLPPARELELMKRRPDIYAQAMRQAEQSGAVSRNKLQMQEAA